MLLLTVSLTSCAPEEGYIPVHGVSPSTTFGFQTAPPNSGSGAQGDPWQISTPEHLAWMADPDYLERLAGYYLLVNDITAPDNLVIAPVPEGSGPMYADSPDIFQGRFNGNGYTITVNIYLPGHDYVGLFGQIGENGLVQSLTVSGRVEGSRATGGLAGINDGKVTDSTAYVEVTGEFEAGGLVGQNFGTVQDSYAAGNVSGESVVGGLVGRSWDGRVLNSQASGNVSGDSSTGGLIGMNGVFEIAVDSEIINSHATGNVRGDEYAGGLVGGNMGTIQGSYAIGNVSGDFSTGGLAGSNFGTIQGSHATGDATGRDVVGGLVGMDMGGTVRNSYASGAVSGDRMVGGLIGITAGELQGGFATGYVSGQFGTGGLIGHNLGRVLNAYATGNVSGQVGTGGLIGHNLGTVLNTYATGHVRNDAEHTERFAHADNGAGGLIGATLDADSGDAELLAMGITFSDSTALLSSVAMNTAVEGPTGFTFRIWGNGIIDNVSGNYASSAIHIYIGGQPFTGAGNRNNRLGQTVAPEKLATEVFWRETMGWDFDDIWIWDSIRNLPTLRDLPRVEVPMSANYDDYDDERG